MPKRKPFHNRLEELFVQTSPEQPGPWEALLTRVEPEEDGWLVGPETLLPEPNVLLVQPVPGAAGAEARREASVSGLTVALRGLAGCRSGSPGAIKRDRHAPPRSGAVPG
jgi:hypothetical protein